MTRTEEKESASLRIHLLGPFRVLADGRAVEERRWSRRKPKLLVKLLALQPHHQLHREQVMELLWPDLDAEAASNNLHKSIYSARRALEPTLQAGARSRFILTYGQQVQLRAPGKLWIDVEAFEQAAAAALKTPDAVAYERALALYEGDLLTEDLYEDWTASRREGLRALRYDLLLKLARLHERGRQYQQSIARLQELLGCDPANEEVHRALMRLYALTGNRHQALVQYRQCAATLLRELEAEPERETVELRRQIESGRIQPPPPGAAPGLTAREPSAIESIAILPLANLTADASLEYLSDGITENIINRLAQLPALRVMAWSTVAHYKGREGAPSAVGRELEVGAVLMGRVLELGARLVVKIELIDVADGSQLWGEQYNRGASDIFALQEEIARDTSEKLRLKLTGEELRRLTERQTESVAAYHAYLKGRYYWNKRTEGGLKKAKEYFERAIGEDPSYAQAYAGLAESYALFSWYSVERPRESFPPGREAALKALALDDSLAEAHNALAFIKHSYDWDWPAAEREFLRAVELNPSYATAHQWYSLHLSGMGRHEEAVAEIGRALELDPLSRVINRDVGWVLHWARRYDEAIEADRKTIELDPNFYIAHYFLGETYDQAGRRGEAVAEFRDTKTHALEGAQVWTLLGLARAHALLGQGDEAHKLIDELEALSRKHYVSPYQVAAIHARLGERTRALRWLEQAYLERDPYLAYLKVEPVLDGLRADPRFKDLVRRVGLTP